MCGVIGYVGNSTTPVFLFNGLRRLEYRGYDSAGIAMLTPSEIKIVKAEGKLRELEKKLDQLPQNATIGIGHTRWATHGKPSELNAHPHQSGSFVLLHNGIIENHTDIRNKLISLGYKFQSETDTEVAVHLLNMEYRSLDKSISASERVKIALSRLVRQIEGSYAFAIICSEAPDLLFAVKHGSPLVLGKGNNENYLASGIAALIDHTREVTILEDGDIAILSQEAIEVFSRDYLKREPEFIQVTWSADMLDKGGYDHYMLKEIHEHPTACRSALKDRINTENSSIILSSMGLKAELLTEINRIQLIACGSSFYAASVAKYHIEELTKIPVELDLASEYRYRVSTSNKYTLAIAISQSGETIDTLFAIKKAKESGAKTLAVVNSPGSSIGLGCDMEMMLNAGPEIGVASTKAFTAQISCLSLVGLALAEIQNVGDLATRKQMLDSLLKLPTLLEDALNLSTKCQKIAEKYLESKNFFFVGRGPLWPVAMEGALKLKEISYIFAEGYAAGELKHGPIALVDENLVVIAIAPRNQYYEKTLSNLQEIKARGGKIIGIGSLGDTEFESLCESFIEIASTDNFSIPVLTTIPLHLFAYWMAVKKGTDVDQPRNLAKSVTVE
jgi:glutamine---fructose-6-phosphate transaminase (isomerizing)